MIDTSARILLVEDSMVDRTLILDSLSSATGFDFSIDHESTLDDAITAMGRTAYAAVLLDLMLPDSYGLNTFDAVHNRFPRIPVIILTGTNDGQTAIKALQLGAQDFLVKAEINSDLLVRSIRYAIERSRLQAQRQDLQKQVLAIGSNERLRISRDLHDSMGQELTGLNMLASTLVRQLQADDSPQTELAEAIASGIQQAISELRDVIQGLTPVEEDASGLQVALENLCASTTKRTGLRCRLECPRTVEFTDTNAATHLFRIAQESVHNALKHAEPSEIVVQLKMDDNGLLLQIVDDGTGIADPAYENHGMGLKLMAYRTELIGASLDIQPTPEGRGTIVSCRLNQTSHCHD